MLADALLILLLGMGGVFVFLLVLILLMQLLSQLLPHVEEAAPARTSGSAAAGQDQLIAVLQAAVHRYEADVFAEEGHDRSSR